MNMNRETPETRNGEAYYNLGYSQGLIDLWGAVKYVLNERTDYIYEAPDWLKSDPETIIKDVKEHKERNAVKVGDVVFSKDYGEDVLVTLVDQGTPNISGWINGLRSDGSIAHMNMDGFIVTGRHINGVDNMLNAISD